MKKTILKTVSAILTVLMILSSFPAFYVSASAASAYDSTYVGGKAGDGKIYAKGLDISNWQGENFDFANVKNAGYDYIIIRCGYSTSEDYMFDAYYDGAKAAGLDVGAYIYSYAESVSEAQAEANACLTWLEGKKFEYPIYFDYEDASQASLSSTTSQNICMAFMDILADNGYLVGVYSMKARLESLPLSTICARYEAWIAHYYDYTHESKDASYWSNYGMYQYTDREYVNGQGPYDANVCYKDYPSIVKQYGFNNYEATQTEVADGTAYKSDYAGGAAGDGKIYANGLDVSNWQGDDFDFQKVKDAGYDYVIIRCGYYTTEDYLFDTYYERAKAAGLGVGAYIYSYAETTSEAQSEANACLTWLSGKTFEYPIYFGYMDSCQDALSSETNQNVCMTFLNTLANNGYLVGLYSSKARLEALPLSTICARYETWITDCTDDNTHESKDADYWSKYGMYQYTNNSYIDEVGPLDANVCYKDYPSIVKKYGFSNYKVSEDTTVPDTTVPDTTTPDTTTPDVTTPEVTTPPETPDIGGGAAYDSNYVGGAAGDGKIYAQGLDISNWQGENFDFENVKSAGYDFIIIRCGYSTSEDSLFDTYYNGAKAAGLDVGAYIYSYAESVSEAQAEANACLTWLEGKTFEYPIYFDYEDASQNSFSSTTSKNICMAFLDILADNGYLVGLYSMKGRLDTLPLSTICARYEAWIAHYYDYTHETKDADYWSKYGMYQYTDRARVNGLGPYDANVCYKDYPSIVKKYGFNNYPAQTSYNYTIEYNSNGGSGTMPNQSAKSDTYATLSPNQFTKDGYEFAGWNVKRKSDGKSLLEIDAENPPVTGYVSGDGVNFRSGPSTNDSIITCMSYGTKFKFISTELYNSEWYYVRLDSGEVGYVYSIYAEMNPVEPVSVTGYVNGDGVNLRSGASTNDSIVTCMAYGTQFTFISTELYNSNWYNIRLSTGEEGYIYGEYAKMKATNHQMYIWCNEDTSPIGYKVAVLQDSQDISQMPINSSGETIVLTANWEVEKLVGDVDSNGIVNIKDVTALQRLIAFGGEITDDLLYVCDTDHDGEATVTDATNIQKYAARLISSF